MTDRPHSYQPGVGIVPKLFTINDPPQHATGRYSMNVKLRPWGIFFDGLWVYLMSYSVIVGLTFVCCGRQAIS